MRTVPVTRDPAARFPLPSRVVRTEEKSKSEGIETGEMKYYYDYVYRREDQMALEEGEPPAPKDLPPQRVKPPLPLTLDLNRSLPMVPVSHSGVSSPSTLRSRD